MKELIQQTLLDLVAIDSLSGQEDKIAGYVVRKLQEIGFTTEVDEKRNVIGLLEGEGESILLNAHMDRVPPGKGHTPQIENNVVKSDGTTNLGADDVAGMTVILEATRIIVEEKKKHSPIVVAFTVEEEIGLFGAKALVLDKYGVKEGIVYDNAFEAGTVVTKGAAYVAFDVLIKGRSVHPGKNLSKGINVVKVFLEVDIPLGETDEGETRLNIGVVSAGGVRNQVPGELTVQGEIRSYLNEKQLSERVEAVKVAFDDAAETSGASAEFSSKTLAVAYKVDESEPLVQRYKKVVEARGGEFKTQETFVASDANVFRGERGLNVFVISTGVTGEHSTEEEVNLGDLELLIFDLALLLESVS